MSGDIANSGGTFNNIIDYFGSMPSNWRWNILPVPHVDKGEDTVEGGHEDVRHGQVQQEVVGHTPHAAVC